MNSSFVSHALIYGCLHHCWFRLTRVEPRAPRDTPRPCLYTIGGVGLDNVTWIPVPLISSSAIAIITVGYLLRSRRLCGTEWFRKTCCTSARPLCNRRIYLLQFPLFRPVKVKVLFPQQTLVMSLLLYSSLYSPFMLPLKCLFRRLYRVGTHTVVASARIVSMRRLYHVLDILTLGHTSKYFNYGDIDTP